MKEIELLKPEKEVNKGLYKGVDLNKVTFPCLCTFNSAGKHEGIINKVRDLNGRDSFELHYLNCPWSSTNRCQVKNCFRDLLEFWEVEFRSGKVIIYDID